VIKSMRAALYARVSTVDQEPENQLAELRTYCDARGWAATEFVDRGVSGSKDRRPALDELLAAAKRRKFDVVICWRLDRLGRSLRHLIVLLDDLNEMGVSFVSLHEGIDLMTPAGRLQLHILASLSEFVRERVRAGLARVRAQGRRLGRKPCGVTDARFAAVAPLSTREAAKQLGVSHTVVARWRAVNKTPWKRRGNPPVFRPRPDRPEPVTESLLKFPLELGHGLSPRAVRSSFGSSDGGADREWEDVSRHVYGKGG
jgi:DNA invertase Pin-like site-specific DNA recombinase